MLYIKAGAASMAGAWFIHRPVRGLYGPVQACPGVYARHAN